MSVAELVRQCFKAFEQTESILHVDDLLDQLGRFRIWAANVNAHSTGRRSLQYRLRESTHLRTTVTSYLEDLLDVLLGPGVQCNHIDADQKDRSDREDGDAALFAVTEIEATSSEGDRIEEIGSIITCLMRVSTALRNPAKDDQVRHALQSSAKHFVPHDLEHVRAKFPHAAEDVLLTLGAALSRHRQYLKYREDHHEKLKEGIDGAQGDTEGCPSTIATSLVPEKKGKDCSITKEAGSTYTETSYAGTETEESHLRLPSMPDAGADGLPFECPLCFHIIELADERSWRRHLYEDLPPYLCIASDCVLRGRHFSRRRDFQRHLKEHQQYWVCPFECSDTFQNSEALKRHLRIRHLQVGGEAATERLLHYSVRTAEPDCVQCPLCLETQPDNKNTLKHLGHHMEQLALFALPSRVFGETGDSGTDDSETDDEASRGFRGPMEGLPLEVISTTDDRAVNDGNADDNSDADDLSDALSDLTRPVARTDSSIDPVGGEASQPDVEPMLLHPNRTSPPVEQIAAPEREDEDNTQLSGSVGSTEQQRMEQQEKHLRSHYCSSVGCVFHDDFGFPTAEDLAKHVADVHNPDATNGSRNKAPKRSRKAPSTYECDRCPKRFTRAFGLRSHMRTHDNVLELACTVCGKRFSTRTASRGFPDVCASCAF